MIICVCDCCGGHGAECILIVKDQSDYPDRCPYDKNKEPDWKCQDKEDEVENPTPTT